MRKVLQQLGKYKRDTFLCIGLTALEVIMGGRKNFCVYGEKSSLIRSRYV